MSLRKNVTTLATSTQKALDDAAVDVNRLYELVGQVSTTQTTEGKKLASLLNELSTNGVIRDIRDLQTRVTALEAENQALKTNGVATAINKLNKEVIAPKKKDDARDFLSGMHRFFGAPDFAVAPEPTLIEKVNAIIEHLGVDVSIQPEKTVAAKVAVTKKPVAKKKRK